MPQRTRKAKDNRLPPKPGGKNKRPNPLPQDSLAVLFDAATGRPPVYSPAIDEIARRFYILGYEDKELADYLGVTEFTITEWARTSPSFSMIRARSKSDADQEIELSLRSRAIGYTHKAEKIHYDKDRGEFVRTEYTQHYPPDPQSASFYLMNRNRQRWKDARALSREGEDDNAATKIIVTGGLPEDDKT